MLQEVNRFNSPPLARRSGKLCYRPRRNINVTGTSGICISFGQNAYLAAPYASNTHDTYVWRMVNMEEAILSVLLKKEKSNWESIQRDKNDLPIVEHRRGS
ncbi:hypothetical protein VNO77_02121 [Canavalia gladiata]|uniref:Uncharacterized protein n=1 Tax=Canavalia gladiata TaxID=3824 RepID=A0AAN9MXN8_CANGL